MMHLRSLIIGVALMLHPGNALTFDNRLPAVDFSQQLREAMQQPESGKYESAAIAKTSPGVCYSPFHNAQYPMNGVGFPTGLDVSMAEDFGIMKNYVSVVRTYYSSYYGFSVAQAAAAHKIKLFLGVFMTNDAWGPSQYTDAVTAVRNYPTTVSAILVGNENIPPVGPYSPSEISTRITELRTRILTETGRSVPIGTVQRAAEWLDPARRSQMLALAANCDIIGVNIYPFFDANYGPEFPLVLLNAIWDNLVSVYGASKLRLTEVGFPTGGAPPSFAPMNVPSVANAKHFYSALVNWNPSQGGHEAFWFMFFDRRPDDNTMQGELEKFFGFFTHTKRSKTSEFPVLLSALTQAKAPTPTTTPTSTPMPAPTTTVPPPTTTAPAPATPTPTTAAPPLSIVLPPAVLPGAQVCRVRKLFL